MFVQNRTEFYTITQESISTRPNIRMSNEETLNWESYKESLEADLIIKKQFLAQTEAILQTLPFDVQHHEKKDVVQDQEPKPMFRPDRSDFIGYSAASCMFGKRVATSRTILEKYLTTEYPKNIDLLLCTLSKELDQRLQLQENDNQSATEHETLLFQLESLIKVTFAENYNTSNVADKEYGEQLWALMLRLIEEDGTLKVKDFNPYAESLFDLLNYNGILQTKFPDQESNSNEEKLVKLIDFNKEYI